ncbi:hypothetical protein GCM10007207_17180 [Asaia siamensis]|uniref:Uncharacterized protein n=1 Tax=Asaia siamensis TaxID=110479 RepID=A0ABQ1M6B4_9PROT|nr:hypothetical protein AA0323_2654 [Asaia siamensis NRIC 0323]GGC32250.1 hypothetical protein GCM10007207_17180 [Asaia siamensis]
MAEDAIALGIEQIILFHVERWHVTRALLIEEAREPDEKLEFLARDNRPYGYVGSRMRRVSSGKPGGIHAVLLSLSRPGDGAGSDHSVSDRVVGDDLAGICCVRQGKLSIAIGRLDLKA